LRAAGKQQMIKYQARKSFTNPGIPHHHRNLIGRKGVGEQFR